MAGLELTPELVVALGRAGARVLGGKGLPFVVGRDTRWSGPMLQAAFSAGVAAEGLDVVDLGVMPTPGVAATAAKLGSPAAVISASHNPFPDNGVKLFTAGGRKLSLEEEEGVARALDVEPSSLQGDHLGRITYDLTAADRYCSQVVDALEGRSLGGLEVVIDCANGAAVATARPILEAAGAKVAAVLGDQPDGTNINSGCGSTEPALLARTVQETGAAVGLAFDGDADRVIAVDDRGEVVDGDRLLALFALDLHERGRLAGDSVVVTVMTNLGFHRAMARAGVTVATTPVGDRQVLEELESQGWSLGGEQSGHIIFRELATTGDGVLTGLLLLDLLFRKGRLLSELGAEAMVPLPQVLLNVHVADPGGLDGAALVWDEVRRVEEELGSGGRVVLRSSGTEKLVRVMVEAPDEVLAGRAVERLADVVRVALGSV